MEKLGGMFDADVISEACDEIEPKGAANAVQS